MTTSPRVPRILHVSASFPRRDDDNVAPFLADLVGAQVTRGWQVRAVALHDRGLPARHLVGGATVRRVRYAPEPWEVLAYRGGGHGGLRSPAHALLLPGMLAVLRAGVVAEMRAARPDAVHGHWLLPAGLVLATLPASARRRTRTVLTLHGTDVELAAGRLRPVARRIASRVDVLLAISDPLARRAETVLGLARGSVRVARLPLPAGLQPSPFPATDAPPRLLAAGRASREKGFDVLLAALREPAAARWQATLVTDGPEAARLRAAADELDGRVVVRPPLPRGELFALVREHHAVVVPSRSEGLGMFAIEALALGRPVVASAVGGLVEVVRDGVDGLLVPPDDAVALAEALGRLPLRAPEAPAAARHAPAPVIAAHAEAYGVAVAAVTG
ncbi:MAG TPA: glycosyltransferase family 4 protein [Solirubrobacteraceae bacterium]|nr:glycosyltransferase family 4 protein [Solirubrobacteraceae bacterium]